MKRHPPSVAAVVTDMPAAGRRGRAPALRRLCWSDLDCKVQAVRSGVVVLEVSCLAGWGRNAGSARRLLMADLPRTNSRVLARIACWTCLGADTPVMVNYRLYQHTSPDPDQRGVMCFGPHLELVFTLMLRDACLDVRDDREAEEFERADFEHGAERQASTKRTSPFREWLRERKQGRQDSAAGGELHGAAGA